MYSNASEKEINTFLTESKQLLRKGKFTFWPRKKNLDSLAQVGLLPSDVPDIILDLDVKDYYKGPKPDFNRKLGGFVWEFKTYLDDTKFYIKLKIERHKEPVMLVCLSFHEDEF